MMKRYKREILSGAIGLILILISVLSISVDIPFVGRLFSFIIIFPLAMAYEESDETRALIMLFYLPLVWFLISFMTYQVIKILWK